MDWCRPWLMVSAQFLHKELPVRLAHRVAELENLPFGLSSKEQVLTVRDWYVESFAELRKFPDIKVGSNVQVVPPRSKPRLVAALATNI